MLIAIPLSLKQANTFVDELHRHHNPSMGDKFRVGVSDGNKLVGVAQVGRPVSRYLDDGQTLEVIRCCTDGTKNACSFLYSRCARIAEEMGYKKIITYILASELGSSLKASGWHCEADNAGGGVGVHLHGHGKSLSRICSDIKKNTLLKRNNGGQKI